MERRNQNPNVEQGGIGKEEQLGPAENLDLEDGDEGAEDSFLVPLEELEQCYLDVIHKLKALECGRAAKDKELKELKKLLKTAQQEIIKKDEIIQALTQQQGAPGKGMKVNDALDK